MQQRQELDAALVHIPEYPNRFRWYFDSMTDERFDAVCAAAIMSYVAEQRYDDGEVSIPDLAALISLMRNRYRRICPQLKAQKSPGRVHYHKPGGAPKLTKRQVRLLREMPGKIKTNEIAKLWGVQRHAVSRARSGKTWRHVT
jgi:hypothetical protein